MRFEILAQFAAVREMELNRGGTPRGEQQRLALRGAHTPLYASPQLARKEPPDPRDDVHALGAIWYQLLKRDPHTAPPIGTEIPERRKTSLWIGPLPPMGLQQPPGRL